jgi:phosphatidylglycerophosphate synthase
MPIITLLHVAVDTALFCAALLHPVYAVCSAVLFLAGWGVQTGFWFRCYAHGAYDHDGGCAEHWLMHSFYGARCAFMMIVLLLYFTYMVFAAMAAHRWRRQRKQQRRGRDSDSFASDIPVAAASQAMASDDMELRDVSSK